MLTRFRPTMTGITATMMAVCLFLTGTAVTQAKPKQPKMTDLSISDKIEEELLYDPGVNPRKIDITTSEGIVTLEGQVSNILAKDRAKRIAQTVRGVRAVVNQIDVKPVAPRSDKELQSDAKEALKSDPATEAMEINTLVEDGQVTLRGTVDSYQERELAETVVKGIRGVRRVENQIEIDYQTERPDEEIQDEIKKGLRWNAYVDDYAIYVEVNDGKVKLTGTVGSAAERRLAESEAWVAGVESVNTAKLSVNSAARDDKLRQDKYVVKSQEKLREAVKDALRRDPRVMAFNVDVSIAGSMATLRGKVDNLKAKRAAEQTARNTVGVTYVNNRLKVRFDAPPSDKAIEQEIREALRRDPYVERFEIKTSVFDGTAHLYGSVDSPFEKSRADELASRISGVVEVRNYLNVEYQEPYLYDRYVEENFVEPGPLEDFEERVPEMTDAQIKESIKSELWWSPFLNADQIKVQVDDGIATLKGKVDTWNEYQAATDNAYEAGATLVDNDIEVTYN